MRRIFLKLGGSLITDKTKVSTARVDVITRLADEINLAIRNFPDLQLLIGHGSGSFGHIPAKKYQTRLGVRTPTEWQGFLEVYRQARQLNQIVFDIFTQEGLPVLAFPPSAIIQASNTKLASWNPEPIISALRAGFIPLVNGDVVFDTMIGGTIFSTEDVFLWLSNELPPDEILLCGLEDGVFEDFPHRSRLLSKITLRDREMILPLLQGSTAPDVTGGMLEKVRLMFTMIENHPSMTAQIFSGSKADNLYKALSGSSIGTIIAKD